MRRGSSYFTMFLVTASTKTVLIYSLKFVIVFICLEIDFFLFSSSNCCENQHFLGLGV